MSRYSVLVQFALDQDTNASPPPPPPRFFSLVSSSPFFYFFVCFCICIDIVINIYESDKQLQYTSTIHTIDSMRKAGEPRWGKSLRTKNIGDLDLDK